MSKIPLILIGGGGHCKSCIEVVESTDTYAIHQILDVREKIGEKVFDYPITASDEDLETLLENKELQYLLTIGQTTNPQIRKRIFNKIKYGNGKLPVVISSKAIVSSRCTIGEGTIIMHAAVVNADVKVGHNCIINNNVNLEHDAEIGHHTHVATNAVINGNCRVGSEVLIGSNSVILQGVSIADSVVIGAGSVVIRDIMEPGIYAGNPARKIRSL
jgi:sugar O-acyltransferase (sialic acid O-acetyltransferase NeuD family)